MKTYRVTIVETITTVYLVPAEDADQAEKQAHTDNEEGVRFRIDSEFCEMEVTVGEVPK